MPGKIIYTPEPVHRCTGRPVLGDWDDRGTKWQCDECQQVWVLVLEEGGLGWRRDKPTPPPPADGSIILAPADTEPEVPSAYIDGMRRYAASEQAERRLNNRRKAGD